MQGAVIVRLIVAAILGIGWFYFVLAIAPGRWGLAAGVAVGLAVIVEAGYTRSPRNR